MALQDHAFYPLSQGTARAFLPCGHFDFREEGDQEQGIR